MINSLDGAMHELAEAIENRPARAPEAASSEKPAEREGSK